MQNFIQTGKNIDYTNDTGNDIVSGQLVVLGGKFVAVATGDIADGETGVLATGGVFEVALDNADTVAFGAKLYWDSAESRLTTVTAGNTFAGWAVEKLSSGATSVKVMIDKNAGAEDTVTAADNVAFSAGSAITGVDGSGSNAASLTETNTRFDGVETAVSSIITNLVAAGLMDAP